jgi:3',5'-cyclic-AMP phosphodiesterase
VTLLIAQLSDPHIRVGPGDGAATRALAAAVDAVLPYDPAAVVVTGDLADTGSPSEYERVRELLAPLAVPVHVLPGNHDDHDALMATFDLPAIQYTAQCGPVKIVACDTTIPGRDDGRFDASRQAWLKEQLEPGTPTLVAMHHPPLITGVPAFDELGMPAEDRHALRQLVGDARVIAGHIHRAAFSGQVFACPSVHIELTLDIDADRPPRQVDDHPAFALHAVIGEELTTHVVSLEG